MNPAIDVSLCFQWLFNLFVFPAAAIPAIDYLILLDVLKACPQRDRIEQDRAALPGGRQPALLASPSSAPPRARGGGLYAMLQNLPKRTHPWQSAEKLPDHVIFDLACDTPRTLPGPESTPEERETVDP